MAGRCSPSLLGAVGTMRLVARGARSGRRRPACGRAVWPVALRLLVGAARWWSGRRWARRSRSTCRSCAASTSPAARTVSPEYVALTLGPGDLHRRLHRRDRALRHPGGAARASGRRRARSGCGRGLVLRKIVLPQALRVIIPPMTSQYLNLTKNSSLAVAIGYQDIVSIANTTLNQTGQAIEGIAIDHGGLPDHQPVDQPVHELVQRAHRAGGALEPCRRPPPNSPRPPGDPVPVASPASRPPRSRRPPPLTAGVGPGRLGAAEPVRLGPSTVVTLRAASTARALGHRASSTGACCTRSGRCRRRRSGPDTDRLPRRAGRRRLLGGDRRQVPLHPVRPLPVRRAVAAGDRASLLFIGALRRLRHAPVLAQGAGR